MMTVVGDRRDESDMGLRVGYAPGVYDLFHIGHLNILRQARRQCDYLIAGVVSDEMAVPGQGPAAGDSARRAAGDRRSITYVDEAVVETVPDKLETWAQHPFDVIFKGDDWRGTAKGDKLERDFAAVGVRGRLLPLHDADLQHLPARGADRLVS